MGEGCGDRADVPGQCVCLFGGTLRSMEPEEGSLRALYASRTEAGGGEGSWVPGAALPQGPSRFARVRVHQLDGITSFWKSALHLDSGFGTPFLLLLLLPQL